MLKKHIGSIACVKIFHLGVGAHNLDIVVGKAHCRLDIEVHKIMLAEIFVRGVKHCRAGRFDPDEKAGAQHYYAHNREKAVSRLAYLFYNVRYKCFVSFHITIRFPQQELAFRLSSQTAPCRYAYGLRGLP